MKKGCIILLLLSIVISCSQSHERNFITVAVAGNLRYVLPSLKREFLIKQPGIKIREIYASSGKLYVMIKNGAPVDVFLSADMEKPEALFKDGLAADRPVVYGYGQLILFSRKHVSFKDGLNILRRKEIKTIAVASRETAPYGQAAYEALLSLNDASVFKKCVFAQNVMQAAEISLLSADAGFISRSVVYSEEMQKYNEKNRFWIQVDRKLHRPLEQCAVVLKTDKKDAAQLFMRFILSDTGRKIFSNYGYTEI